MPRRTRPGPLPGPPPGPGLCQEETGLTGWDAQASLFLLWNWSFALGGPYSWWEKLFGTEFEFKGQLVAYLTMGT